VEPADLPQSEWMQQPAPQATAEKKAAPKDKIFDEIADLDTSDSWDGSADSDDDDGDDE